MAKEPTLGKKHTCFKCACKFYDLGRTDSVCPRCGANQKLARRDELKATAARTARRPVVEIEEEDLDALPPPGDEIGYGETDLPGDEFLEEDLGGTMEELEGPLPEEEEVLDDEE